jgi:hypothetical protein
MNGKNINDISFPPFVPSSSSGLALSAVEGLLGVFQQPVSLIRFFHRDFSHSTACGVLVSVWRNVSSSFFVVRLGHRHTVGIIFHDAL